MGNTNSRNLFNEFLQSSYSRKFRPAKYIYVSAIRYTTQSFPHLQSVIPPLFPRNEAAGSPPPRPLFLPHHHHPPPREGSQIFPANDPPQSINHPREGSRNFAFDEPQRSFNPSHQRENYSINEPHAPHEGGQRENFPPNEPRFERRHLLPTPVSSSDQSHRWDDRDDRNFPADPPDHRYSPPRDCWRDFSPPQHHDDSYREETNFERDRRDNFHGDDHENNQFDEERRDDRFFESRFQPPGEQNFRPRSPDFRPGPPDFHPRSPDFGPPFPPHPDPPRRGPPPREAEFNENQFYRQRENFDPPNEHDNYRVSPTRRFFDDDRPPTHNFEHGSPRFDEEPPDFDRERPPAFNRPSDFINERRPPQFGEGSEFDQPRHFNPRPEFSRPPAAPRFEGPRFHNGGDHFGGTPPPVYHHDEQVDNFSCPPTCPPGSVGREP